MVIDNHANIIAQHYNPSPKSSVRRLSVQDIAQTALRSNIAKGAFNVNKNKTGTATIHVQYNAMDMLMYQLDNGMNLVVLGFIEPQSIQHIFNIISKEFPTKGKRAIIVDDEQDIRISIQDVLEKRGFDVVQCDSATACFETIRKAKDEKKEFGIIVLDIRMPGINGFEAFNEIQRLMPNANVLFITAYEYSEKFVSEKVSSPKVRVLRKPFGRTELLQTVNEVIESQ
jgi:CheY-like chemotaxis protein